MGAILAPMTVPFIAAKYGWQEAFIITGAFGFIWLIFWFIFYEIPSKQKRLKQPEFDYIHSDLDEKEAVSAMVEGAVKEETKRVPWLTFKF